MVLHLHHSFTLTVAIVCSFCATASQGGTTEQFTCYQGSIESDTKGQIPLGSERRLTVIPCVPPTSPTRTITEPPTTAAATTVPRTSAKPPSIKPTTPRPATTPTPGSASRKRRDVSSYLCTVLQSFPKGSKLTLNATWTANFSCMPIDKCLKNMFCCNTPNCNSLSYFKQVSHTKTATVGECLLGYKNSTASNIVVKNCQGGSHFCFNRTLNGATIFGCSVAERDAKCANITGGETDQCTKDGNSILCCCTSDKCNGIPPVAPVNPSRIVPTTTPYRGTASRTSSHWMLVIFIAAGALIGGLVGLFVMVMCKRWKKKLNISYSIIF